MLSFTSDYNTGAHPKILQAFSDTNYENLAGYGNDIYSERAKEKIKKCLQNDNAEIYFLIGGTQTNQVIIDTVLAPYEGVISAESGHIGVHEAGAIEFTGHKVLPLKATNGKITAEQIKNYLLSFYADENHSAMVMPGMVYVSFPTEYGTLYTKEELANIYAVCKEYNLSFFIDGARLGYGLESKENNIKITDLSNLCDVFYIGGTKVGALCGEAVVFTHQNAPKYFMTQVKRHGAMIAKGRLLGVQFDALFTDNLYFEISKHAIEMAEELKEIFKKKGYQFFLNSPTNQQFIILENTKMEELKKQVEFGFWEQFDNTHTVVRFATTWSTTKEHLIALEKLL